MGKKIVSLRDAKSLFAAGQAVHIAIKLLISTPLFLLVLLVLLRLLR